MNLRGFFKSVFDFATKVKIPDHVIGYAITGRTQSPRRRREYEERRRSDYRHRPRHRRPDMISEEELLGAFDERMEATLDSMQDREELVDMAPEFIRQCLEDHNVHRSSYADYYREILMGQLEDRDFYSCYFRAIALGACGCGDDACQFTEAA